MKRTIGILLAVLMLTALMGTAYADSSGLGIEPGQAFPDFTVSLTDGTTATLSELLKEKDLVVLNVFASWCGPCEMEFPEMEKSYQAHSDRMVILSVSGDPSDTMEMIADYKASHGLSFPMGLAGDALGFLKVSAFPTTVFIAKDGKVGFVSINGGRVSEPFEYVSRKAHAYGWLVSKDGKHYGFVSSKTGTLVIPLKYKGFWDEGPEMLRFDGKIDIYDENFRLLRTENIPND